jgi:hypothetical protein
MLRAPIDLKPDGSDYYTQCWRCRRSTSRPVSKRRKIDVTTTGALVQPSAPSPNLSGSMRRQLAQVQSIANLRGAFNPPPASSTSSGLTAGTGSTLSNINVQAPVPVPAAAPALHTQPAPSIAAPPPNPMDFDPALHTGTSTINESINFLPRGKDSGDTPEMAEARRQRVIVRRDHRRRERGGEEVSLTPGLSQFRHPYRYEEPGSPLTPPPPSSQLLTPSGAPSRPFLPLDQDDGPKDHFVESPLSRRSSMSSYRGRGRSDSVRPRGSPSRSRSRSRSQARSRTPSSSSISTKLCFHCPNCSEERPMLVDHQNMELCTYCMLSPPEYNRSHQLICCYPRHHIVMYADMLDEDGKRHEICNECRGLGFPSSAPVQSQSSRPDLSSSNRFLSSQLLSQFLSTDPFSSSQAPRGRGHADLGAVYRNRQARSNAFAVHDPPLDLSSEEWRDDPALTARDYQLLNNFHDKLDRERLETCSRCEEMWFHMGLDDNRVCSSCQKVDKNLEDEMPFLYSGANEMDPGPIPLGLEQLTQIEEMLIARVYCFVEVRQVRGVQYKYKGHIVNFLANTPKVYNRLPLLPKDLNIIIIRPFN